MQIECRISSLLEYYAEMQQSSAKVSQIECRISSLLVYYAEMQQSSAKISILSEYKLLFRLNYCFLAQISLVIVAFLLNLHNKQTININSVHYETVFQERGSHRCGHFRLWYYHGHLYLHQPDRHADEWRQAFVA